MSSPHRRRFIAAHFTIYSFGRGKSLALGWGGLVEAYETPETATAVASLLPWGLARMGADPALASGPIATVLQDLLSVAIYLGIATALL